MKIRKLTIDETEINKAVEMYLASQGISLPVHSVSKEYNFAKDWEIIFEFEVEKSDPPATVSEPLPPVMPAEAEGGAK